MLSFNLFDQIRQNHTCTNPYYFIPQLTKDTLAPPFKNNVMPPIFVYADHISNAIDDNLYFLPQMVMTDKRGSTCWSSQINSEQFSEGYFNSIRLPKLQFLILSCCSIVKPSAVLHIVFDAQRVSISLTFSTTRQELGPSPSILLVEWLEYKSEYLKYVY